MKRVLVPLPDRDFDVTEVAVPWKLLRRAGHEAVFATGNGAVAAGDPRLISGVIFGQLGADAEAKAFYGELLESPEFRHPLTWDSLRPADFDALLLPGGHAPGMRQYLGSELLQSKVADFWSSQKPVAAICHGVLVLARSRHQGRSVLHASSTTSLTKWQERLAYALTFWRLGKYYRTYPEYVEDEVRAALDNPGRQYQRGPITWGARGTATYDDPAFVVEDGRYVSARWPGDAYLFARKLIDRL
jgi:putative intracellular protease/amidase